MINWLIFSRNRASQLDLLLRSTKYFFKEYKETKINVLYTHSNDFFKKGYDKIISEYPEINFIKEESFKNNLVKTIDDKNTYTIFFVDDQIFKEPFSLSEITNEWSDIVCVSLRLHPRLNYCYAANSPMRPLFRTKWEWCNETGDNSYAMSVDSHIFLTSEIKPLLERLSYNNPNQLEIQLSSNVINKPCMVCFEKSKTINNPCNKVQTNNPNRFGNISAEYLNQEYLVDRLIDFRPFKGIDNESCHKELPISFIDKQIDKFLI